jgi:hypothetical protein
MEEKRSKEAPKSFLDHNASWPLTLLYLGFLIGIYFAQQFSYNNFISDMSAYAYYFIAILGGVIGTFLFYNLGKIIVGNMIGYKVILVKLLGLTINKAGKEKKISYSILDFFSLSLQFAPKDDDVDKNPTLLFFGGAFFEGILLVLALVFMLTFHVTTKGSLANFAWTFLFVVCYGFLTPLYEMLPLRQDYPTDMFNVLMTKSSEDRKAYNIYQINRRRELTGEDFIVPEFESYDSFYKLHTLYYVYLRNLYESKLEKAFSVLEDMKYYAKYYLEDERYLPMAETIYLKFLIDDEAGANKAYLSIKKDERKNVTDPLTLTGYRIAILVLASIHSDREAINNLLKNHDAKLASLDVKDSYRTKKDEELFLQAYKKAQKLSTSIELPDRD